jgi:uncharacterized metal-binding protein YceD (DUF177 family)
MTNTDTPAPWHQPKIVADLPLNRAFEFSLTPDAGLRRSIADALSIVSLRKLRFEGTLTPMAKNDWHLTGQLGATAVQNCVITLDPVTTRIDEAIDRRFQDLAQDHDHDADSETEIPQDDTVEPIGTVIDPGQIMVEALILALPQFPRAPGAELVQSNFTAPGKLAMSDADARPFAQLSELRNKLKNDND